MNYFLKMAIRRLPAGLAVVLFWSSLAGQAQTNSQGVPLVTTLLAGSVMISNATFMGRLNPNGADTVAWFEWGTTTNYGNSTPTVFFARTNGLVSTSNVVAGLILGTSYHYELVASNAVGVGNGGDAAFTTPVFGLINSGLCGVDYGSLAAADFDGDDKMDVVINGEISDSNLLRGLTTVWRNLGGATFENWSELATNGFGVFDDPDITYGAPLGAAVSVGDFYNSGREDVLLSGATIDYPDANVLQLWRNLGNGGFTLVTNSGLPGILAYTAVGDFDNDGRLDIVVYVPGSTLALYRNTGNGIFKLADSKLNYLKIGGPSRGPIVGDFDNDGYLDLLVGTVVWRNLGNGTFTNLSDGIPVYDYTYAVCAGDFSGTGKLDVLQNDTTYFRNRGDGTFLTGLKLTGFTPLAGGVGDFDNDGYVDTLAGFSSYDISSSVSVALNLTNGTFTNISPVPRVLGLTAIPGGFSGDGRLDFMVTGVQGVDSNKFAVNVTQVWQNFYGGSNSPPTAPTNLVEEVLGRGGVKLMWGAATDDHTPVSGLNYNIRVGSSPGGMDIVSPEANPVTGFRRVVRMGNAQERLFSLLTNLSGGTYYWSVQAIDTAFAGGAFAAEASFVMPPNIGSAGFGTNGQFRVGFNGLASNSYSLQGSVDLAGWTNLVSVVAGSNGVVELVDTNAGNFGRRFYRVGTP